MDPSGPAAPVDPPSKPQNNPGLPSPDSSPTATSPKTEKPAAVKPRLPEITVMKTHPSLFRVLVVILIFGLIASFYYFFWELYKLNSQTPVVPKATIAAKAKPN